MRRRLVCFALLLAGLPLPSISHAEPLPEYAMKAAFVYNFILFTDWPTLPNNTLQICTLESDTLKQELEQFIEKKPHGARLVITKVFNLDAIKQCQALFLSEDDRQRIPSILAFLEKSPVLTITDVQGLVGKGVIISMRIENKRIIFEVDAMAAKKSNLYLSSKFLNLAKKVY